MREIPPIQAIDLDGAEEYHYAMWLNSKNGTAQLKLVASKTHMKHSFLGIDFETKILSKRYVVYLAGTGKKYFIGFPNYGKGQANAWLAEDFEKNYIDKPGQFVSFYLNYADEMHSKMASDASIIQNTQNASLETTIPMSYKSLCFKAAKDRVSTRISGMRNRNSGSFKAFFNRSRINGTSSRMSDLDLFIITENPNFFKTVNRGGKILESIKAGFKKSSGMDLDINVMTNQEYNRAKSGELKTSTQKYKENIIVK